jgi:hypothetical protein
VDASPFATVTVTSQQGQKVLTDETPFTVSLAPGPYTFEFVSAGQEPKKVTKQIAAGPTDAVRVEFWTPEETRKLLENYIQGRFELHSRCSFAAYRPRSFMHRLRSPSRAINVKRPMDRDALQMRCRH